MNTQQQTAPDISPGYPSKGRRLGPAWQQMWDEIQRADKPLDGCALAERVAKQHHLARLTLHAVLARAATAGLLAKQARGVQVEAFKTVKGERREFTTTRVRTHYAPVR